MPNLKITGVTILALALFWAPGGIAQTVLNGNVPAGFLQAGYIEAATLNALGGGTLTMNGITMIVPANTVVQFPANTLTWAQLFNSGTNLNPVYDSALSSTQVSPAITLGATGLAMADNPGILGYTAAAPSGLGPEMPFNAIVQGNIDVQNSTGNGAGAYIIGLILPINQDVGNGGVGFINCIDYAKGRFEVGGTASTLPGGACGATATGTVIELNDPTGRYGFAHSPDPRWSVDPDNPTVSSFNGYPMGIPKVAPPATPSATAPCTLANGCDPDRPWFNRPLNTPAVDPFLQAGAPLIAFSMPSSPAPGATQPDPWKQAPFMVGDFVVYTGVLYSNNPKAFLNPTIPINQQTYISANTVTSGNLMIYTSPGRIGRVGPAYIQISGRMVIGNGGDPLTVPPNPGGAAGILGGTIPNLDPKLNIDIRGYCTDPTALVDIFAIDVSPTSGTASLRLLGTVIPDSGVAGTPAPKGVAGRFRLQVGKGDFLPTTRAYTAVTHHGTVQLAPQVGNITPANGLLAGQYQAPMFNFIFPDPPQGFPAIPTNFNTMPFLFVGEGGNPSAGPLTPFPPFTP
jgi:hypothetical protein